MTASVLSQLAAKDAAWSLAMAGAEHRGRGRWGPCPACGTDDRRGVLLVGDRVWTCTRCQVSGGSMVTAAILAGEPPRGADWRAVAAWVDRADWFDGDDDAIPPPPPDVEIRGKLPPLWSADRTAWHALLRGVPYDLAVLGSVTYREDRTTDDLIGIENARTMWAASNRVDEPVRRLYRVLSVLMWRNAATVEQSITVPRDIGRAVDRFT